MEAEPSPEALEPDPLRQALDHVRADSTVEHAVREAVALADLTVLRTSTARAELGADPAKEFALTVQRSHVDLAVAPDVARDHAERFGFVRQRSNGKTTVIRVASSQLAIGEKRAAWPGLVQLAVEHRESCPDRVEPRVATAAAAAKRPARPAATRRVGGDTTRRPTVTAAPASPTNLCPVHGTEMLGGMCDRCD